jgi:signal transduction histidine kinase
MHRLAVELRPAALDDLGLQVAVQNYVEDWIQQTGLEVDFHVSGADAPVPRAVEIVVYRVIQEALTNVIKHAEARHVGIVLRQACGHLQLIVDDDGRGFDAERMMIPSSAGRRLGLLGMAERVSQVGGRIEVNSEPGRGSEIVVRIPIGDDEGEPSCE